MRVLMGVPVNVDADSWRASKRWRNVRPSIENCNMTALSQGRLQRRRRGAGHRGDRPYGENSKPVVSWRG